MKQNKKGAMINIPIIIYFLGASFMMIMAFTILSGNLNALNSKVIFIGSVITTASASVTPLLSINKFSLSSYQIKMWSIVFGLLIGMATGYSLQLSLDWAVELFKYSSKGLLWVINISLLLFSLVALEIEYSETKMKLIAEEINTAKRKLLEKDKLILEKNKEIIELQKQQIENNKGGSNNEIY